MRFALALRAAADAVRRSGDICLSDASGANAHDAAGDAR
jgi:hypothetical protein